MDRKQFKEEQKLVDEAAWIIREMQKPIYVYRMARGRYFWPDNNPSVEKSIRTRMVNASREIVKLRDRWNHRTLNNGAQWSVMSDIMYDLRVEGFVNRTVEAQTDMIIRQLRDRGYRITKRESWE